MGRYIRAYAWEKTFLGKPEDWPISLKTLVSVLLGSSQPMFLSWGPDLTLIYNDAYSEILGKKHPSALGQPFLDVWHEIRADLKPIVDQVYSGEPVHMDDIELIMERHGYPEETHFSFSYTPIISLDGKRKVEGFFCPCTEITEQVMAARRLSEQKEKFQTLITAITDTVYRMSGDWSEMMILQSKHFLSDTSQSSHDWMDKYIPEDEQGRVRKAINKSIDKKLPFELEHRVIRADGTIGWTFSRAIPILGQNGEILEWFGPASDITARKTFEKALVGAKAEAEAASAAKTEFLANMSHEIRSPMTAVIGITDLLKRQPDMEEEKRYELLNILTSAANSLMDLINDLLDISKIEANQLSLEDIPFQVVSIIKDVVTVNQMKAEEKGVDLVGNTSSGEDHFYMGDPVRIKQILINLVSNAIKFTDAGGNVTIGYETIPDRKEHPKLCDLTFTVTDNGIGIPEDKLNHIFDKFTQADTSITRRYGGTGLGLSICKSLAEMMGGAITVQSKVGEGSTFKLSLQCQVAESYIEPSDVGHNKPHLHSAGSVRPRLLLVEDIPSNIVVAGHILTELGFDYDAAQNGEEAIEKIMENHDKYCAVLMDVQMPGKDGLEVTRIIRSVEQQEGLDAIPVIAVTAHGFAADKTRCLDAGMDAYINKPYERNELASVIQYYGAKKCEGI